jgi:Kef-type K+ transport system membrane component KefB
VSVLAQLTLIAAAGVAAPLLAETVKRLGVPGVVIELGLGIVLGPQVAHLVSPSGLVLYFANIGLALLMFLAGYELDLATVRGRPLKLAGTSWAASLVLALVVVLVLVAAGHRHGALVVGLALTTTALGTLLPVLRDTGVLDSPFGTFMLAIGSVGEFGPIVLIALLLGHTNPVLTALLLIGFGVLAVGFAFAAARPWGARVTDGLRRGLHSSSQLPVRVSMLLVIALVLLAANLGLDVLLGAFAAGIIVRVAVAGREDTDEATAFRGKLEAIGFGLFVPIFFVVSGARLDLHIFTRHPAALIGVPVFLLLMLIGRGLPTLVGYRRVLPARQRVAIALMSATGLPLIVVVTTIGVTDGQVATQTAAALVTAGVLSVLILPALGGWVLRRSVRQQRDQ